MRIIRDKDEKRRLRQSFFCFDFNHVIMKREKYKKRDIFLKEFFNHIESNIVKFLAKISFFSLMIVGLVIVYFLFMELWHMVALAFEPETTERYYDVLKSILSFFFFF
jgi:protein PsiE